MTCVGLSYSLIKLSIFSLYLNYIRPKFSRMRYIGDSSRLSHFLIKFPILVTLNRGNYVWSDSCLNLIRRRQSGSVIFPIIFPFSLYDGIWDRISERTSKIHRLLQQVKTEDQNSMELVLGESQKNYEEFF